MTRRVAGKFFGAVALAAGIGVVGGAAFGAVLMPAAVRPLPHLGSAEPDYQVNSSGESFGSAADAARPDLEPDLIRVFSDQGDVGYIRKAELDPPPFKSPEEAVAWQAARDTAGAVKLPVFASDGRTRIGTFTVDTSAERTVTP